MTTYVVLRLAATDQLEAAEYNGPMIFAQIGMMQAINRHRVKESNTSRKTTHWGKRKLRREE